MSFSFNEINIKYCINKNNNKFIKTNNNNKLLLLSSSDETSYIKIINYLIKVTFDLKLIKRYILTIHEVKIQDWRTVHLYLIALYYLRFKKKRKKEKKEGNFVASVNTNSVIKHPFSMTQ